MHISRCSVYGSLLLSLVLGLLPGRMSQAADEPAHTVKIKGILGRAQLSRDGGIFGPLLTGMNLRVGDVVRTAAASAVDLDLGTGPGIVRLTEGTMMAIEKLSGSATNEGSYVVELSLRTGELLGLSKAGPADSSFEIKIPVGIFQVSHGQFRVQARGYLVVVDGKALFAHVPPGGQPAAHTLTAPPACYFTPLTGVHPAPRELVREVKNQYKAKLKQK